ETDYKRIEAHCRNVLDFPVTEFLDWDDIAALQKDGHEIGGHSMYHMNIGEADPEKILTDVTQTWDILKKNCGAANHFAFPYGRFFHFNEAGRRAVFQAGFRSCASAERGCHVNPETPLTPEQLCIRRDHILLNWGIDQISYFIANNARKASTQNNLFPDLQ
ncbi:MAG: putative polysaccharide deacetylase, partial [Flavipsychrobacter sp.]|nr:putative polysaccharide deacetylase [Flavipsychrobacter sp.]